MSKSVLLIFSLLTICASSALAVVNVTSPNNGGTYQGSVHYVASATTSSCAKGVGSMGIYTAPGVLAYVVNGANMNTNLSLAPGTYHTVVEEWDNCGGAGTAAVTITVNAQSGVYITAPVSNGNVSSPVNFTATATSSSTLLLNLVDRVSITMERRVGSARLTTMPIAASDTSNRKVMAPIQDQRMPRLLPRCGFCSPGDEGRVIWAMPEGESILSRLAGLRGLQRSFMTTLFSAPDGRLLRWSRQCLAAYGGVGLTLKRAFDGPRARSRGSAAGPFKFLAGLGVLGRFLANGRRTFRRTQLHASSSRLG